MQSKKQWKRVAARTLALGAYLAFGLTGGCGGGDESEAVPTYEEVATILGVAEEGQSSCSLGGCHGGNGVANLTLAPGVDLVAATVNVPACEAPELDLVEPGDPENSWLYIKLVAEIEDSRSGTLVEQPEWGEPASDCPNAAGFGKRMPRVPPFETLPEEELSIVYEWIKGGAPGPT